jgi:pimeloyl-ACP methyl ester carboxylesterase
MGDICVAVIDGTGDYNDASYNASMRYSFCNQIAGQLGDAARYERGPSTEGDRVHERGERAAEFLEDGHRRGAHRLILAGYSRGGSAAIMAAEILKKQGKGIAVDAMFLFDPVARHASKGGTVVPANVSLLYIARRRLDPTMVAKYDHTIGPLGHSIFHNPIRVFFGETATRHAASVRAVVSDFLGSHGAIGGVGWKHVTEDTECQKQVAAFMNRAFAKTSVPVRLTAYPPSTEP